jgi:hypothetical protein
MHLYDTSDPGVVVGRPKFWITLIFLSLATYALAGLALWLVRSHKTSQPVKKEKDTRVDQQVKESEKIDAHKKGSSGKGTKGWGSRFHLHMKRTTRQQSLNEGVPLNDLP